jgi:signal transduction histidine kinase/CHASE1-domain containing sensor protein/HAMP domain-containing protein
MVRVFRSVRVQILLILVLFTVLIAVMLGIFINSSRQSERYARLIDTVGEVRTLTANIDLLTRSITATTINNQNIELAFNSALEQDVQLLNSILQLHKVNGSVSREEFAAFLPFIDIDFRSQRTDFPEILAVAYVPSIPESEREAFETQVINEGFDGFAIWEFGEEGMPVSAQTRAVYLPINYLVPFTPNRSISFGWDIGSNNYILPTLNQVRDSAEILILPDPPHPIAGAEADYAIWMIGPVYGGEIPETLAERQSAIQGYVIFSIDVETLIESATSRFSESVIVLKIQDVSASEPELLFQSSRIQFIDPSASLERSLHIDVLGHQWQVILPQRVDVELSLEELEGAALYLNELVTTIGTGEDLPTFTGLSQLSDAIINSPYTTLVEGHSILQRNVATFIATEDNSERQGLLPALEQNTIRTIADSTALVNLLVSQLEARVQRSIEISSVAAVLALVLSVFGALAVRRILYNLSQVNQTALEIAVGNLQARNTVVSRDEIGQIGLSMNFMADQLEELINTLEQRVARRTRDLQVAADVAIQITNVLDLDTLLISLVNETRAEFDMYYCSIFLFDEGTNRLILRAGTGHAGTQLMEQGYHFELENPNGLVPLSARERKPIVINDVSDSENHKKNPFLPDTLSEITLPMMIGERLLGVLDFQSNHHNRFQQDDVKVMTTLAAQIAVAVRNAQLFSEAREARQAAERSDQAKSSFLASMSHELRTPLNAIINFTKFVAKGKLGPVNDEQNKTLLEVVDSAKHLLNLINDVLDMSKIESGSLKLLVTDGVDVNGIISKVVSTGKVLLHGKPVEIEIHIDDNLPNIRADRQRLFQILLNIMSNACKFTEQGLIKIKAYQSDDDVVIAITDTGPGISPEDQDAVFQAFQQTDSGIRQGGGTGLGMPISKKLVEAHGGYLILNSELGIGTTFTIQLPIKSEELVPTF